MKEQKPETTSQLIGFVQKTTNLSEKEIINLLNQLEAEDKIHFNVKQRRLRFVWNLPFYVRVSMVLDHNSSSFSNYVNCFYYSTRLVSAGVCSQRFRRDICVVLAWICLRKSFVSKRRFRFKTSSESFDNIERVALSIGMSIALSPIVGLILYYTPLGIGLTPITLSLLALTAVFATAAVAREYLAKSNISTNLLITFKMLLFCTNFY